MRTVQQRYKLLEALGSGSMGEAFVAHDLVRDGRVALKLLHLDPQLVHHFQVEFSVLTSVAHPNLVRVHDFGRFLDEPGDLRHFYTSELIVGRPLDAYLRARSWEAAAPVLRQVLDGLSYLHGVGIRHGDIKPDNVLVDDDGRAVLIDLGCARPSSETRPIVLSGTPAYMAPELSGGGRVDHRADLYSLGVTLERIAPGLSDSPPTPVKRLVGRLCHLDPTQRPADAAEALETLGGSPLLAHPAVVEPGSILGREQLRDDFDQHLGALLEGRSGNRVWVLHGPSGIGKTRLLRELKWRAQARTTVVDTDAGRPDAFSCLIRLADGVDRLRPRLDEVLAARDRIRARGEPTVLVLDDVHRLSPQERELFDAWARSSEPGDPTLLIATSDRPLDEGEAVLSAEIGPLSRRHVTEWVGRLLPASKIDTLMELSEGVPRTVRRVVERLATGDLTEDRLGMEVAQDMPSQGMLGAGDYEQAQRLVLERLGEDSLRVIGLLTIAGGALDEHVIAALGSDALAAARLADRGLLRREGARLRLDRIEDASLFERLLPRPLIEQLHLSMAQHLAGVAASEPLPGGEEGSELLARRARHLAAGAAWAEAEALVSEAREHWSAHPRHWVEVAGLLAAGPSVEGRLLSARVHESSGHPERAVSLLAVLLAQRPPDAQRLAAHEAIASASLRCGNYPRALRHLRALRTVVVDVEGRARLADLMARVLIKKGEYVQARACAEEALDGCDETAYAWADLHDDVGVAATYLADMVGARRHLDEAARCHERRRDARAQVRSLSYRALSDYRDGRNDAAMEGFASALSLAEEAGLADQIAHAALSFGAGAHQRGQWGRAYASYERGLRMAVALGKTGTQITLRFNLAKLYADIGMFDRAEATARRVRVEAGRAGMGLFEGAAFSVLGEAAWGSRDLDAALRHFEASRKVFIREGASREVVEVNLSTAEALLEDGRSSEAEECLRDLERAESASGAVDISARVALLRGRQKLSLGHAREALEDLSRALAGAASSGRDPLIAEVEGQLAEAHELLGAPVLARRHREQAQALWERIASTLDPTWHDAFWLHGRRARLRDHARDEPRIARMSTERERKLTRLLEINKKLAGLLKTNEVLATTMDAAVELTGAERGFVILVSEDQRKGDKLQVVVARNLDRERIGRSHLKFSRSIAEKVIATAEPLVTTDAQQDERFLSNTSVHSMRLKSVVSVPIVNPSGVLGALYLDNRFQQGRFEQEDLDLLVAFADQVAIALGNARLHAELELRTRELEAERNRVQGLLDGREQEIERLVAEVRVRQQALEHRYDYSRIVGRSPPMQRVFEVLDRITDSAVPVLVQGESGTGKELIARAIHFNGPRHEEPFVAVNCGALPTNLMESEFFGHVKGAFTGADTDRPGLFVEAHGGTLFLDEIGEMPLDLQVKLLRVLQEREVRAVGGDRAVPVDVRIVGATNRDLREEVAAGHFREDLYYRLGVVEVPVPPLRERIEDLPALVEHLVARIADSHSMSPPRVEPSALRVLMSHDWPGNVRQLENVLTNAMLLSSSGALDAASIQVGRTGPPAAAPRSREAFRREEATRIAQALRERGWNVSEVSRDLGIPRATLYRKLKLYDLMRPSDT